MLKQLHNSQRRDRAVDTQANEFEFEKERKNNCVVDTQTNEFEFKKERKKDTAFNQ